MDEPTETFEELLHAISQQLAFIKRVLPEHLENDFDPASFEIDHLACILVGSLIYRTEEVGRNAFEMLKSRNLVASSLLSRAVLENAAIVFALRTYIVRENNDEQCDLFEKINCLVFGSRILDDPQTDGMEKLPKSISVITHLNKLRAHEPTVMDNYDFMSELSHPNGAGVMGLFCKFQSDKSLTTFGRNEENIESLMQAAAINLTYSLRVFMDEYFKTNSAIAEWLKDKVV